MLQSLDYRAGKILVLFLLPFIAKAQSAADLEALPYRNGEKFEYTTLANDAIVKFDVCDSAITAQFLNKPDFKVSNKDLLKTIKNEAVTVAGNYVSNSAYLLQKYQVNTTKYYLLYVPLNVYSGCLILTDLKSIYIVVSSNGTYSNTSSTYIVNSKLIKTVVSFDKKSHACSGKKIVTYDKVWKQITKNEPCSGEIFRNPVIGTPDIHVVGAPHTDQPPE